MNIVLFVLTAAVDEVGPDGKKIRPGIDSATVDELADLCGMSTSNLKKVYSMYSVFSIHKYFVKLKIARAIEMLEEGYNVTEISDKLGFNNQNYFSIVFKRETSMSPLNYRKNILEK